MPVDAALYRRHRFPAEIISHAVWLYFRFNLSHRDVEELLVDRGIQVSYEAIRLWCRKFGPAYAEQVRRRRAAPADKWHVDEMQLKIRGRKYWLWRAVGHPRPGAAQRAGRGGVPAPRPRSSRRCAAGDRHR